LEPDTEMMLICHCRDGKTPEERTKQVLQITTILPGQTPDRRFSIPSRRSTASISKVESAKSANPEKLVAEEDEGQQEEAPLVDVSEAAVEDKGDADGGVEEAAVPPTGKPAETVRRLDSETNDVDEFLDAHS
jgi:hypothetical protein